jgi:hypothetical protein
MTKSAKGTFGEIATRARIYFALGHGTSTDTDCGESLLGMLVTCFVTNEILVEAAGVEPFLPI